MLYTELVEETGDGYGKIRLYRELILVKENNPRN
jgi:hypothetical protein